MTVHTRPRRLEWSAGLVAAGIGVQLASFGWNHPLAFIAFAVVGGGLMTAGVVSYAATVVRARSMPRADRPSTPDRR